MCLSKSTIVAGILVFIFSSCLLQSEEKYFKQVDPTPDARYQNPISYSYGDNGSFFPLKDTVWLSNKVRFQWGSVSKVYKTTILINDQLAATAGANVAIYGTNLEIAKGTITNGIYNLKIKQQVATGTGSLADKLSNEFVEYTTSYVLVVESANTYTPKITSIVLKDGSLKISWNQYPRDDFQYYKIIKQGSSSNPNRELIVKNQQQTTLTDTTFVSAPLNYYTGEPKPVNYQLIVNNGDDMSSVTYPVNYTYQPTGTLTKISDNLFRFSWTQPATYNSVKNYHIKFIPFQGYTYLADVQVDPSVSYIDIARPLGLGFIYSFEVDLNSKADKYIDGLGEQSDYIGTVALDCRRVPYVRDILHDTQKSSFYLLSTSYSNATLYQLDDKTLNVIDSVVTTYPGGTYQGRILASANGQYHYLMDVYSLRRFDPNNLSITETTSIFTFDPAIYRADVFPTNSSTDITAVTDNNYVLFHDAGNSYATHYSYVANMNTKTLVFKFSGTGHLSSDGMFLVNGSNLYAFSSGTYSKVLTLPYSSVTYEQFLNGTSQVVLQTATSVIVYDCASQIEVASYPIAGIGMFTHLDQSSRKIFLVPANYPIKILDLKDGTVRDIYDSSNSLLEGDILFYGPCALKNY